MPGATPSPATSPLHETSERSIRILMHAYNPIGSQETLLLLVVVRLLHLGSTVALGVHLSVLCVSFE